jgi:isoquinoline 1-oxidoreductase subunit beta
MSAPRGISRREFVKSGAIAGAGLILAARAGTALVWSAHGGGNAPGFSPSVYLRIQPDNQIFYWVTRSEMGQGVRTTLPMILAEELEADYRSLQLVQAPTIPAFKGIRLRTSGSGSSVGTARALRQAGATAREMLITAAANNWAVDRKECRAENGFVVHGESAGRLSYGELALAAAKLEVPKEVVLKAFKDFKLIGKPVRRFDGPAIVQGQARYGFDVRQPGMRFAAIARCPYLGGKALRWDDSKATAVPGVREIIPVTTGIATGVAVTADNSWAAFRGCDLLQVIWDPGPHAKFSSEDYFKQLHAALDTEGFLARRYGDIRKALQDSETRVEAVYEYPFQAHATLEPMNCTAEVKKDRCEIWAPTQCPEVAQQETAKMLGLPVDAVKVNITLLGGGFGRRLFADYVPEAVELSRATGRPVQVVWSRRDDMRHGFFQPAEAIRLIAGLDANGKALGLVHKQAAADLSMFGPSENDPERYAKNGDPWGGFDNPYNFPAFDVRFIPVPSPVPTGPWRAVEYPSTIFARECFIDELALAAGKDPLAFRLEILQPRDTFTMGDSVIDRGRLANSLEVAADKAQWSSPMARELQGRRWGRGIACNTYFGESYIAQVAEVSVGAKGDVRVHRVVCAIDCGLVFNPLGLEGQAESAITWGLSAALKGQITFRNGGAEQSNYLDFPVMRMNEAPEMEFHVIQSNAPPGGFGEHCVPPIMPAVVNAVFAATGKRVRRLPITSADLAA